MSDLSQSETSVRIPTPLMRYFCKKPYWCWWLLFRLSPWHRGYDVGYQQAVKALAASQPPSRGQSEC